MRVVLATLLFTLALASPALAGGWAVTTLDTLPPEIHSGQTYQIGYTIRQHGVTPRNVEEMGGTTEIVATSPDGKTLTFEGVQTGPTGHYVAAVTLPSAGAWQWQVTQGPFEPQPLGTLTVLGAAAAAPAQPAAAGAPAPASSGPNALTVVALLLAASGAAVLFGTRLAIFATRRASA